jgi:hypothetical protein
MIEASVPLIGAEAKFAITTEDISVMSSTAILQAQSM